MASAVERVRDRLKRATAALEAAGIEYAVIGGNAVAAWSDQEVRRDAVNAVACALAMRRTLAELNRTWAAGQLPQIGMRIGIFTGPVVSGSLGRRERVAYTVIGDTIDESTVGRGTNASI